MFFRIICILFIIFSLSIEVFADSAGLLINQESSSNYTVQVYGNTVVHEGDFGNIELNGRFIHTRHNNSGSCGLDVFHNKINFNDLRVGVGARLFLGKNDGVDSYVSALTPGILMEYTPSALDWLVLKGLFYHTLVGDRLFEVNLSIGFNITDQILIYTGYQNIRTEKLWFDKKLWGSDGNKYWKGRRSIVEGPILGIEYKF